jgi:hypothetical protein
MSMRSRTLALALFAALAVAAATRPVWSSEQEQPSYSLEGSWLGVATIPGFGTFPYMDTYAGGVTTPMMGGTALCTVPVGSIPTPAGPVSFTHTAQGSWLHTAKNEYAITLWRIRLDGTGKPVGLAKFWGTLTMTSEDAFSGTLNVEIYSASGTLLNRITGGTANASRIQVQLE